MKKQNIKLLSILVLAAIVVGIFLWRFATPPATGKLQPSGTMPVTVKNAAEPASSIDQPVTSEQTPGVVSNSEEAATRSMYAAHAPLRAPELADPDSAANLRILQTMVGKAIARKQETGADEQ